MKTIYKFLITLGIGLAIALIAMLGYGVFSLTDTAQLYRRLSDSFFIPGVVIAGFGLLIFASNGGVFDMLSYGVGTFFSVFRRNMKRKHKDFYEYQKARHEKDRSFGYLVLAGVVLIAVAAVFVLLYLKVTA
jgi:hypothetical protein